MGEISDGPPCASWSPSFGEASSCLTWPRHERSSSSKPRPRGRPVRPPGDPAALSGVSPLREVS